MDCHDPSFKLSEICMTPLGRGGHYVCLLTLIRGLGKLTSVQKINGHYLKGVGR